MHVLLGIAEQRALRYDDFAAYYRRVRAGFEAAIAAPAAIEPYPVEHCALCHFRGACAARWEAEDHLVQVANVRRDQVTRLRDAGLSTLAALARSAPGATVARIAAHTAEPRNFKSLFRGRQPVPPAPPPRATIAPPAAEVKRLPEGDAPLAVLSSGAPSTTLPSWRQAERGRGPNAGGMLTITKKRGICDRPIIERVAAAR